jgi:hypothetical protein
VNGSLALHRSALFVGSEEKTARVRVFDLDGHERLEGFSFRDHRAGRSVASGLAVDDDRRVWVADTPASRVRRFSLFGREDGGLGLGLEEPIGGPPWPDRRGTIRAPVDVAVDGNSEAGQLVVACGGEGRHAVQVFDAAGVHVFSPRPRGDAHGTFRDVRGVAKLGRLLYVAETGGERVQVFRDFGFHFSFSVPCRGGGVFEPVAVAPLSDGRMVLACSGRTSALLFVDGAGALLRFLAEEGDETGGVSRPTDVVVEAEPDASARIAVVDREGERVQVFTLSGRCYGAFSQRA